MSGEKDATDPQSKDYMWVYHSPGTDNSKKIYLYDYDNGSRSTEVIKNFLAITKVSLFRTDMYHIIPWEKQMITLR